MIKNIAVRFYKQFETKNKRIIAMIPSDICPIADEVDLRLRYLQPMSRASDKVLDHLDFHCLSILTLSPFYSLPNHRLEGADISPRGDPPGFLRVLDDRHLLLPNRIGKMIGWIILLISWSILRLDYWF